MINYAAPTLKKYNSIYGIASIVNDIDQIKDFWNPAFKVWFPDSEPNDTVILLSFTACDIDYWDGRCSKIIVGSNTGDAYKKKGYCNWQALNY